MSNKITLSKYMTREHSIFYASVWDEANRSHWDKYFLAKNIENMVFLIDKEKMLEVYYDLPELDSTLKEVGDGVVKNPETTDKIIEEFRKNTEILASYFEGKKKIQTPEELKSHYRTLVEWWMGLEHVFVVPDQMQAPEDIRKKMLKMREETQEYSESIDKPYIDFIKEKYPQFAEYVHVIKPEEAYRIDKLSDDEINNIKERLDGCVLATINGKSVFLQGTDLAKKLANLGVTLLDSSMNLKFNKIYTRDTTYIMQELWAWGCSEGIEKEFGWKNPYLPGIIHHMKEGSIEIWENLKATEWLEDVILKRNEKDPKFIDQILETYKDKLSEIHKLWGKKILPINDLKTLIKLSNDALPYFIAYYYSAVNEKTPQEIRDKALEMRNKDEFFATNDIVIRDSMLSIYPEIRGYETAVFFEELDSIPDMEILKERRQYSSLIQGKEKHIGDLSDLRKIHPEFYFIEEQETVNDIKEIRGQIAQKGKVVGKVRILKRRDQVGEVQEGDIIVSPMTTPDFLPAMKIAGAFVTDEGGITCHAGIVARELKKPCVIGTKIATQVLKDGMEVEVDADTGIVKIIK